MHRLVIALTCIAAIVGLVACGGASTSSSVAPPPSAKSGGGPVSVQPTNGLIGPAESVVQGRVKVVGRTRPMTAQTVRPTGVKLNGVSAQAACASAAASPSGTNLRAMSAAILCLLNAQRASHGMGRLRLNTRLGRAARSMAAMMVRQRFFSHTTPSGRTLVDRIRPTGYMRGSWQIGENLAWGSGAFATPASIVNSWMHSPGHRANILHAAFRDIGVSLQLGPPSPSFSGGATYVTDFGRHS